MQARKTGVMAELPKTPGELIAALQAAAGSTANALNPQQLAELLLTAASVLQRTNEVLDRVDRLLKLAEPAIATIDRVAPVLEEMSDALGNVPGLGRFKRE